MRIAGRIVFALFALGLAGLAIALLWARLPYVERLARTDQLDAGDANFSIVYPLRNEATRFVFSRPQKQARIITNAGVVPNGPEPTYAYTLEALNNDGAVVWEKTIYLRSIRLYVRRQNGRLVHRAFIAGRQGLVPSAADATLVDFGREVSSIRLSQTWLGAGVGSILARVQEYRPVTNRQLQVGWQRLSCAEREELAAGSALGPALVTQEERRRLLAFRWNPVGPSGIRGRHYHQSALYERSGEEDHLPVPGRMSLCHDSLAPLQHSQSGWRS
jgi:hypothetical protein